MRKSSEQELRTKAAYNRRPDVQARRVENNRARRKAIREGRASVGDGKDVAHAVSMDKSGKTSGATTVQDRKTNRGWRGREPGMYSKGKTKSPKAKKK